MDAELDDELKMLGVEVEGDRRSDENGSRRAASSFRWLGPVSLVVVVVVALLVGSGLFSASHTSEAGRVRSIESEIRCPSCEDVSVADSTVSTSIAVRHQIAKMVSAGYSDTQIKNALVSQYGPTILLRPPTSGLVAAVWVIPALVAVSAVVGLGILFWRRSDEFRRIKRG